MTNRLRATALTGIALLNVITLGAGVAVAALLPGRLALWRVPRVTAARTAVPRQVLSPAMSRGLPPTRPGLAAALGPLLASPALGAHAGAVVTDPASGAVLFSRLASAPFTPASCAKLVTAAAALSVLGPGTRFTTRVVPGATPGSLVLVGGGDPTLAAGRPPSSDYPQPATLVSLAHATLRWLHARGLRSVRLAYDTSLFTGPPLAPGWSISYIRTGNVTPLTALEVDQGRLTAAGRPQDADVPGNFRARSFTPAADAAAAFASFLRAGGGRVRGRVTAGNAPAGSRPVAAVSSPPVSAITGWMLRESNNVIAEDLARQVALASGRPASFRGAAAAVTAAVRRLGAGAGIHLVDGSGLSTSDRITPRALGSVVALAAGQCSLRPAEAELPVWVASPA